MENEFPGLLLSYCYYFIRMAILDPFLYITCWHILPKVDNIYLYIWEVLVFVFLLGVLSVEQYNSNVIIEI